MQRTGPRKPDNLFLGPLKDGKFHLVPVKGSARPSQFSSNNGTERLSFHFGPENQHLALQVQKGHQGLMTLVDIAGLSKDEVQRAVQIPKDTPTKWACSRLGRVMVEDRC